ncbi:MAG: ribonuclease R [bacterium]|nr:ribonuclease R [bacterium]
MTKNKKTQNKAESTHKSLIGSISITSKGTGYVEIAGFKEDTEIDYKHLNTALHGDVVEILLFPKTESRTRGEVSKIVSRSKTSFVGVLEEENNVFFLKPDDNKMYTDILIPNDFLNGAKNGDKVFGEIILWKDPRKSPEGKIVSILGKPGDHNTEMHAIALEKGFAEKLPDEVEKEGERIKLTGITESDYKDRRDFRNTLTFTIDPADAKDFDDAISFKELGGNSATDGANYEIGIHIADVSYYVKPGSALDTEAQKRGTSVYLVDRTIPMLPESLSNNLCSLVPNEDRLTMSAVFEINKNAEVVSSWFGRTVIHSQKRFTYEEAEVSIHKQGAPLHKELSILNDLAKKLTKERLANGAILLEQEEVKFVLDQNGVPIKVMKKQRGDSNKLIEEFMLLANKKVAELFSKKNKNNKNKDVPTRKNEESVFIYRVHDSPNLEKMTDLAFFLRSLGHKVALQDGVIPTQQINKILRDLEGKPEKDTVDRAIVRSMAKAIYSTANIGHYGLAFTNYTHFTSPIRRYPDVIVHRLLMEHLANKKVPDNSKEKVTLYEGIARRSSEQEKRATEAERASIKYKQVEYMSLRIGSTFEGMVSGVSEWGIYVEETETKCEGMVRVRDMSDDFYIFNEKKLEMIGQKKKKRFRLGDRVKMKVKAVDLERKTIDYVLI